MNITYILQCYMYTWVHARIKQISRGPEDNFVCEGGVPRLEHFFFSNYLNTMKFKFHMGEGGIWNPCPTIDPRTR